MRTARTTGRRDRLRGRREELRLSIDQVARAIDVDRKTVWRWEIGQSDPYRRQHPAIADTLQWPLDHIDQLLTQDDARRSGVTVDELDAVFATGARPRSTGSYPAADDLTRTRTADAGYVASVRDSTQHIIDLDTQHGGDDLVALAVRSFRAAHQRLASGLFVAGLEHDLSAAVGEAGEVAAWVAYDADRQPLSRQLNQEALLISRLAGDRSMELFELANLAMQSVHLGRSVEALRIAETVLADDHLTGRTAALFHVRRGRSLAQLGQRRRALDALGRARALLAEGITTDDPAWTWWVDDSELDWHEAMSLASLDDWRRAVDLFRRAHERRPADKTRSRYNDLAHLAEGLVAVGAWRDAEAVMVDVIASAGDISSARTTSLLRRVIHRIDRARDDATPSLVDTSDELREMLSMPASPS